MLLLFLSLLYYGFRDKMLKRRPSKRFVLLESGETTTTAIATSLLSSPILSSVAATATTATTITTATTTETNSENVHNNNNNNNNKVFLNDDFPRIDNNNNNGNTINDNDHSDHRSDSGRDLHRRNSEPANPQYSIGGKIKIPPLARILFNGNEVGGCTSEDGKKAQIADSIVAITIIK